MITAEEFLDNIEIWDGVFVHSTKARKAMIEFAKMHVKEALKEASENAYIEDFGSMQEGTTVIIDEDSILNAYPLENIK